MVSNPKEGQLVRVRYRKSIAHKLPLHDKLGFVATPGCGRPRNHLVEIDNRRYVIPAGNLMMVLPGGKVIVSVTPIHPTPPGEASTER